MNFDDIEDIQMLQVKVPRDCILQIATMKKAKRVRREQVVIDAIASAFKAFEAETKRDAGVNVVNKVVNRK